MAAPSIVHALFSTLSFFWYFLDVVVLSLILYSADFFWTKPTLSPKKAFILNSLTCSCKICTPKRKERNLNALKIPLMLMMFFFIIYIFAINKLYGGLDRGFYPKRNIAETDFKIKFGELEVGLRTRLENEYYEINKIGDEIIKDQEGDYYIVDLKMMDDAEIFFFDEGEYVMGNFDKKLYKPLNAFINDVYSYLDAGSECALFLKGSADILGNATLSESLREGYDNGPYNRIEYFPEIAPGIYKKIPQIHIVGDKYTNADLPFLRSTFLKEKIANTFQGIKMPKILEGKVEDRISSNDRNATLIMFVDFKKKKFLN